MARRSINALADCWFAVSSAPLISAGGDEREVKRMNSDEKFIGGFESLDGVVDAAGVRMRDQVFQGDGAQPAVKSGS